MKKPKRFIVILLIITMVTAAVAVIPPLVGGRNYCENRETNTEEEYYSQSQVTSPSSAINPFNVGNFSHTFHGTRGTLTPVALPSTTFRAIDRIIIPNTQVATTFTSGNWTYLSFIQNIHVIRQDGRPIWGTSEALNNNHIIDFHAAFYLNMRPMPHRNNGTFWTRNQARITIPNFISFGSWDHWGNNGELWSAVHEFRSQPSNRMERMGWIELNERTWHTVDPEFEFHFGFNGWGYSRDGIGLTFNSVRIDRSITPRIRAAGRTFANSLLPPAHGFHSRYIHGWTNMPAIIMNRPGIVQTTNWNNFIAVNGQQITPSQTSTQARPNSNRGINIPVNNEGITRVMFEDRELWNQTATGATWMNSSEVFVIVDMHTPTVTANFRNQGALNQMLVGTATTAANGNRTQTIGNMFFANEVSFNFGPLEGQSQQSATVFGPDGVVRNYTSGQVLNQPGIYQVIVSSEAGHRKILNFTIGSGTPTENLARLHAQQHRVSRWYIAAIPTSYTGSGNFSFRSREDALVHAMHYERLNMVTNRHLAAVNQFQNHHLLAPGQIPRAGPFWMYRSMQNRNLFLYYFDENDLLDVIRHYANEFIRGPNHFADVGLNDYGNRIQPCMIDNLVGGFPIANDFVFQTRSHLESHRIFHSFMPTITSAFNWVEFQYNIAFGQQVTRHGVYAIREVNLVGLETIYFVFVDREAPVLDVEVRVFGGNSFRRTISANDIPVHGNMVFYYEQFRIVGIHDDDPWWILQVRDPSGTTRRFSHIDPIPIFETPGEHLITAYDRFGNRFSFTMHLVGAAPTVVFTPQGDNTRLNIRIQPNAGNTIMDLRIFRNHNLLNSPTGFREFPDDPDSPLILINTNTLEYSFVRGGIYRVEILDLFGRWTIQEFIFERNLPQGILVGVARDGRTQGNVSFTYNRDHIISSVTRNGVPYLPQVSTMPHNNLATYSFSPRNNADDFYEITLFDITDFSVFTLYRFTIRTRAPDLTLIGVADGGNTGGTVFATWANAPELSATVTHNGVSRPYNRENLTADGVYSITLRDDIGNQTTVSFTIDRTVRFTIFANGLQVTPEQIRYTNRQIVIWDGERPLDIVVAKNGLPHAYNFGLTLSQDGYYQVSISDRYGNTAFFSFTIDTQPPVITLDGVEHGGITRYDVTATWNKEATARLYLNDEFIGPYTMGHVLNQNGRYRLVVTDQAGNTSIALFEIKNEVQFSINTFFGGVSSEPVIIVNHEQLFMELRRNGEIIEYTFGEPITVDGNYELILVDHMGNTVVFPFTVAIRARQNFLFNLQDNATILSVTKDGQSFTDTHADFSFHFIVEGVYIVTVFCEIAGQEFIFTIRIDTTPPTLELIGVDRDGIARETVTTRNLSKPAEIRAYRNGEFFHYEIGQVLRLVGRYRIVLTDEAGNYTVYEFEIIHALNTASIAVLGGLLALAVVIIAVTYRARRGKGGYFAPTKKLDKSKGKTEEETIPEEKADDPLKRKNRVKSDLNSKQDKEQPQTR